MRLLRPGYRRLTASRFSSAAASRRSYVSKPSVNPSKTVATRPRASPARPWLRRNVVGVDVQAVGVALADEDGRLRAALATRLEEGAEPGDADGERARGGVGRRAGPGRLEQRVHRHGPPRIAQQACENGPFLGARGRALRPRSCDLESPEDAEVHGATIPPP